MYHACDAAFAHSDISIMAAAVADYKPKNKAEQKIKKADDALEISLVKNKDILAHLGQVKAEGQILVGFALETDNEMANALQKLKKKNADFIVLNSLQDVGAGFGSDTNKVTIIAKDGSSNELPLMSKKETATAIIQTITNLH
jgi:phosphopantothenoylcysteine decarboxylase/phosphopantothenate--cysteine ligase